MNALRFHCARACARSRFRSLRIRLFCSSQIPMSYNLKNIWQSYFLDVLFAVRAACFSPAVGQLRSLCPPDLTSECLLGPQRLSSGGCLVATVCLCWGRPQWIPFIFMDVICDQLS